MAVKMSEKTQWEAAFGSRRNPFDRITLNDWGPCGPMLPFRAFQVDKRLNAPLRYQQS